jgi:hypothetical protein
MAPVPRHEQEARDLMDTLHRILSGQSLTRRELVGAGVFVLTWWLMDVIQFADFLWGKL